MIFNGGKIPRDIVATSLQPKIVIVNRKEKYIELMDMQF